MVDIVKNDISGLGVYYRTHVQNIGWQEQKGNGALSGTTGFGYRLEAIRIVLLPKGSPAREPLNNHLFKISQSGKF